MSESTHIRWTNATWNPVTGCTKVSAGCKNCYAERVFPRAYAGQTVTEVTGHPDSPDGALYVMRPRRFTDVRTHPERLDRPLHWRKPRRVFVNSMSDLFHEDVPDEFIDRVFQTMWQATQHTFQVLTKRPDRMRDYASALVGTWLPGGPPPNVWLGVSVEDQATADERIPILLDTPAATRFVSYEPALGPIDFTPFPARWEAVVAGSRICEPRRVTGIDWIIVGGESGPEARPMHPEWMRSTIRQGRDAGVPVFCKQLGAWRECPAGDVSVKDPRTIAIHPAGMTAMRPDNPFNPWERAHHHWIGMRRVGGHGGDIEEWPEDLRVREFPAGRRSA